MNQSPEPSPRAWQPLTPRGVAAFAHARLGRLWLVQFAVLLLITGAVVWFLNARVCPVLSEAILHLPAEGEIRSGSLDWRGDSPTLLAEGRFLSVAVDLDHAATRRSPAHLQLEFGREDCQVIMLLGSRSIPYPREAVLAFGRRDLEPQWGAWRPDLLALAALAMACALVASWTLLATLYTLPVWALARVCRRDLGLAGAWRLAGAGLMPAALLMVAAIVAYGLGAMDVIGLGLAALVHFVVGWAFSAAAILALPRRVGPETGPGNPFARASAGSPPGANPFASPETPSAPAPAPSPLPPPPTPPTTTARGD